MAQTLTVWKDASSINIGKITFFLFPEKKTNPTIVHTAITIYAEKTTAPFLYWINNQRVEVAHIKNATP